MNKIDKGIPMPTARSGIAVYPWADMEIGDSFAVQLIDRERVRSAASLQRERRGWSFVTRTVTEDGDTVVRVWRTK